MPEKGKESSLPLAWGFVKLHLFAAIHALTAASLFQLSQFVLVDISTFQFCTQNDRSKSLVQHFPTSTTS